MTRKMDIQPIEGHEFQWTRNWFRNRNLPSFREYVYYWWVGKPMVYLELGVFEGQSLVWMMQHVLDHPDSRAVGVDPWLMTRKLNESMMEGVRLRALNNLCPWTYPMDASCERWKLELIRGNSAEVLRKMCGRGGFSGIGRGTVDLCMVDGNHNALAVLDDLRFVYKLVKPGGWILLDDVENQQPKKDHVKEGLAMFLEEQPMEMIWKHRYCEAYRR